MASVNIDVAAVVKEIRESLQLVYNANEKRKTKRNEARLIVYRALALHPVLDNLHLLEPYDYSFRKLCAIYAPPNESPSWLSKTLLGRRNDKHFTKVAQLATTGTRAKVMLILLWIIGNRLEDGIVDSLISNVCENGIRLGTALREDEAADLVKQIAGLGEAFVSLRRTIKKRLPIEKDPYKDLKLELSRDDTMLCAHTFPKHLYDVRKDPLYLLQPASATTPMAGLPAKHESVIIPENELTRLIIDWSMKNYQLGKDVRTEADIDHRAYWHAHCRCEHRTGG
ncbi:hypothetical protein D9757_005992 [Collybiopsis confluens]|uniref:Uncharacterized protein n=1 Tax=Collybiopsis confluens TaxID=2823264 RepID=A0A8H5MDC2_9AGAR|nr:hypothetical protein D9757_005992 [Collybiopsis confluens]